MTHVVTEPEHDPDAEHRERCPTRSDFEDDGHVHVIADHFERVSVEVEPDDIDAMSARCETRDCTTEGDRHHWRLILRGCGEEQESWTYCTPHVTPAFLDALARIESGRMWEHE